MTENSFRLVLLISCLLVLTNSTRSKLKKEVLNCKDKVSKNSFLWALKRDPPVYFFGTIHVPYTRVWSHISQTVKKAYDGSNNVYFELDLTDIKTLAALTHCQLLPTNTGLSEVLPPELYQRLKQHLEYVKFAMPKWVTAEQKEKGLYPDILYDVIVGNWERKKPIWVMLMINSLTEADIKSRGTPVLDLYLARKAEKLGKNVGAVEKVEEQCLPLNNLKMSQVIFALNHTLMIQEKLRRGKMDVSYTTDDLINQYNCGNLDGVMFDKESVQISSLVNHSQPDLAETESPMNGTDEIMATDIDTYFKSELIYQRNERMAKRVKTLLDKNPRDSYFFAFGAGHFLGNGSVIDFLKQYGYEIESVDRQILYKKKNGDNLRKRRKGKNQRKKTRRNRPHRQSGKRRRRKKKKRRKMPAQTSSSKRANFPSVNGALQFDGSYTYLDQADIRIINHFPTVVPFPFHGNWRRFRTNKKLFSQNVRTSRNPKYKNRKSKGKKKRHFRNSKNNLSLSADLENLGFQLWKQSTTIPNVTGGTESAQTHKFSFQFLFSLLQTLTATFIILLV